MHARYFVSGLMVVVSLSVSAQDTIDTTLAFSVRTTYATGEISSSPFEHKQVIAAQGDAACFVATQGTCRGAYLEAAFDWLRQQPTIASASDMALAQAIVAHLQ